MTFGPQPRDYSYSLPRKVRRAALRSALSEKIRDNKLLVLAEINLPQIRTKDFVQAMTNLGAAQALILTEKEDFNLKLSARNVKDFKVLPIQGLNLYDLLQFEYLILTQGALKELEKMLD